MENSVKNLIQFIDHSPSCFHVIENAKTVLGTWFYTVRRKRTLEFRRRKKLLCRTKMKFYDSIPSSKEGFSRISHRGKSQ